MPVNTVILGAGFGGLETAKYLGDNLPDTHDVTLIDRNDYFIVGFTKFDVMFGRRSLNDVTTSYDRLALKNVDFIQDDVVDIDVDGKVVRTSSNEFSYDFLVVALGAELASNVTPGFVDNGCEFYSLDGAVELNRTVEAFESGRILISIFGKPYQCPPAPFEAAFQLADYFNDRGIREAVTIEVLSPDPVPLPVSEQASGIVEERMEYLGIEFRPQTKVVELHPKRAELASGEMIEYDLCIGIPVHRPPAVVRNSVLSSDGGWIQVDNRSLRTAFDGVYAVGDVAHIPAGDRPVPKAGSFAESAGLVVAKDIVNTVRGEDKLDVFEGSGTCYLEFGEDEVGALNADFLGGDHPDVTIMGPSKDLRREKRSFETDRVARWFT